MPTIPHFTVPFALGPTGAAAVDQDTLAEIASNVNAIVACSAGACPELPAFGIPDPTFQGAPPNPSAILQAIARIEPRAATVATVAAADKTGGGWQITITPHVAATGQ